MRSITVEAHRAPLPAVSGAAHGRSARPVAVAALALCLATLFVGFLVMVGEAERQIVTPAGLLLFSTMLPAACMYAVGRFDLLEPIQIISSIIALNFGVRALYLVWGKSRTMYWLFGRGEYLPSVPS